MATTVFELQAILGLDSSAFENGLKTVAKFGVAALGAATTAMAGMGAASVKTGAEFDKSMSQVAATMGKTTEEIQDLRDFAEEMGRTTAFSATQSADALNYMALAGYDAETSMKMLPNVLNLAAAGNMDLARASDMVTDTQTAFGISLERTTQMVDEMAKAASTGNTSVEQLGDAFLTVGGLAQELNGGMVVLDDGTEVAVDGIQELEIALTAMANAGIKGSEAGTHMRNMLTKLSSPSSDGTKALEKMGVTVFDTAGEMRSLSDIFGDLSDKMGEMTQEQKIQTITDLFNARDLASAEAMLNAVNQDWDKIGSSIIEAEGAASKMAETQLDNLAGDVTLFKSALEGAQIAISDKLTPSLRDFVKFATEGLSKITKAFTEGGLEGAMNKFGLILSDGITMVLEKVPQMVSAGAQLLSALIKGLLKNKKKIFDAVKQIMKAITDTISKEFPTLKSIMDKIQKVFDAVFGFIEKHGPLIKATIEGILAGFLAYNAAITVFTSMQKAIALVGTAIKVLNGELTASSLINPYSAMATALAVVIGLVVTLAQKEKEERQACYDSIVAISEETQKAAEFATDYISKLKDMYNSNMKIKESVEEQIQPEQDLVNELRNIVDENGHVKEGYEERAGVITEELATAFDTEINYQNGVIEKYDEVMEKLDSLIEKKKLEALIDAGKEDYANAMRDQIELSNGLTDAQNEYNQAVQDYDDAYERFLWAQGQRNDYAQRGLAGLNREWSEIDKQYRDAQSELEAYGQKLDELEQKLDTSSQAYYSNQDYINDYNSALEMATSGVGDFEVAVDNLTNGIITNAPQEVLRQQLEEYTNDLDAILKAYENGANVSTEQIEEASRRVQLAIDALNGTDQDMQATTDAFNRAAQEVQSTPDAFNRAGQDARTGYANAFAENSDVIEAARQMVADGLTAVQDAQDSHSPSKEFKKLGVYALEGYELGFMSRLNYLIITVKRIVGEVEKVFKNIVKDASVWGTDFMDNFIEGVKSKIAELRAVVEEVGNMVKDNLGHSHPKEGPLADDYTWMPDMMDLFVQGIKDNKKLLHNTIVDAFDFKNLIATPNVSEAVADNNNVAPVNNTFNITIEQPVETPSDMARALREELQYGLLRDEAYV